MEPFFLHLLKSSGVMLLFLGCYLLLLRNETFFNGNRWFLLGGIGLALLAPFAPITETVLVAPLNVYQSTYSVVPTEVSNSKGIFDFLDWETAVLLAYLLGVLFFGGRLLLQFLAIKKLIKSGMLYKDHPFYHVRTLRDVSPFSFFRYIFYHKETFDPSELKSVIAHEKVHAREYHSVDILIMEAVMVLFWFNPFIWWYRNCLKQNLEFLADAKSCSEGEGKKFYQYLMLKQVLGPHRLTLANPFYNSLIKKRIVMLNQNHSKKSRMLKMLLIIPVVTIFLMSFNTKTIYVTDPSAFEAGVNLEQGRSISVTINKDTSNEELKNIKEKFAKDGIDLSYTVVHNDKMEIIDIAIHISGKNSDGETFSGNYNSSSSEPIKPLTIHYDDTTNTISFGNSHDKTISIHSDSNHEVSIDVEHEHKEGDVEVHIDSGHNGEQHENEKLDEEVHVSIASDSHDGLEAIPGSNGLLFRNSNSNGEPIYFLDGKKVQEKEVKKLSPDAIQSISVYKGEGAIKKYGNKAKNGAIEIITKSNYNKSSNSGKKIQSKKGEKEEKSHSDGETHEHTPNDDKVVLTSKLSPIDLNNIAAFNQAKNNMSPKTLESNRLILLNGKEISYQEFIALKPENITSISVNKKPFMTSLYGDKTKNGYISVSTKKLSATIGHPVKF
ncbi:M56 family metallopeptidase [Flagellimonas myxillae]|uniref:M56 family metallopeptidase n=1 Tax=Flagellimonas myxillae TaxID=2942214 RepID=UPI00201F2863|nr:M56 family metallopeptidase [Muricauda myxillae]MCL6265172.1 M56 family metallopeptidase [Muricauda myxillae]